MGLPVQASILVPKVSDLDDPHGFDSFNAHSADPVARTTAPRAA